MIKIIFLLLVDLEAVKTYSPVRSIDDLVRGISKTVSVYHTVWILQNDGHHWWSYNGPVSLLTSILFQLLANEMTEDIKHAVIDSLFTKDQYGHHLDKNYDWMDDYMV